MTQRFRKFTDNIISRSVICAITGIGTAVAQEHEDSEPQGMTHSFEEVIVTAQKREQSIQDVPMSISALSSSDMEGLKLRSSIEIASQVPNMQISTPYGDGFPIISLRGVSMNDFSLNQSSPVAVYVDEVFKGNPALQGVQLFDLERIEVLRGPQGTLYGKNATGGAVNFVTRKAGADTEKYLSFGLGSYNRREVQGAYQSEILEDTLAIRLAGTRTVEDGWMENKVPGIDDAGAVDEWGSRISLAFTPTESLHADLRVSSSRSEPVNYGIIAEAGQFGAGNGFYELFDALGQAIGGTNGGSDSSYIRHGLDDFETESNSDAKRKIGTDSASLTINWDISSVLTLTAISSWDEGTFFVPEDADGSPLRILESDFTSSADQVAQDLRITSAFEGPFNFISGLYLSNETTNVATTTRLYNDLDVNQDGDLNSFDCLDPVMYAFGVGGNGNTTDNADLLNGILPSLGLGISGLGDFAILGCQVNNNFEQDRRSRAAYFDGTYDLSDALTMRFGVRYTDDTSDLNDMEARLLDNTGADLTPYIGMTIPTMSTSNDDQEWSGKIGLDYTTKGDSLIFANYSKGYRSGAYNAQAFLSPSEVNYVAPETLYALEVGFKSTLLDGAAQVSGAAFHYDYDNQQFLNIDTETLAQSLINIESSTIRGMEIEISAFPTDTLRISGGLGIIDAEVAQGTLSGIELAGKKLVSAPEVNANFSADYFYAVGDEGTVTFHIDGSYVDDLYFDIFNSESIKQDAYWLTNARISYDPGTTENDLSISVWAKNLRNERYSNLSLDLQETFGMNYHNIGSPFMMGLEVSWSFQ